MSIVPVATFRRSVKHVELVTDEEGKGADSEDLSREIIVVRIGLDVISIVVSVILVKISAISELGFGKVFRDVSIPVKVSFRRRICKLVLVSVFYSLVVAPSD